MEQRQECRRCSLKPALQLTDLHVKMVSDAQQNFPVHFTHGVNLHALVRLATFAAFACLAVNSWCVLGRVLGRKIFGNSMFQCLFREPKILLSVLRRVLRESKMSPPALGGFFGKRKRRFHTFNAFIFNTFLQRHSVLPLCENVLPGVENPRAKFTSKNTHKTWLLT